MAKIKDHIFPFFFKHIFYIKNQSLKNILFLTIFVHDCYYLFYWESILSHKYYPGNHYTQIINVINSIFNEMF